MTKRKIWKRIGIACASLILLLVVVTAVYIGNYYHASSQAFDAVKSSKAVEVTKEGNTK